MKFVYLLLLILQYSLFCPPKKLCQYDSKSDVKIKFRNECGHRIKLQQHDGNCDKQQQGEIGPNAQETISAKLTSVFTATILGDDELKPINGECYQQPENKLQTGEAITLAAICANSGPVGPARPSTSICPQTSCIDPHITETKTKVHLVLNNLCYGSSVTVKQGDDCDGQVKQLVVGRDGEHHMEATTHTWFTAQAAGEKVQINDNCRFFPVKQKTQQVNLCAKSGDFGLDLSNASELIKGKLQIMFGQNKWYRICQDNFTDIEADLACKQMGHKKGALVTVQRPKQQFSNGCWLDTLQISSTCTGKENTLKECISGEKVQHCKDDVDVGVICQKGTTMQTKGLRIVDSRLNDNTIGLYSDQESNEGETYCEQVSTGGNVTTTQKKYSYGYYKALAKKYWMEIGLGITGFVMILIGISIRQWCKEKTSKKKKSRLEIYQDDESQDVENQNNVESQIVLTQEVETPIIISKKSKKKHINTGQKVLTCRCKNEIAADLAQNLREKDQVTGFWEIECPQCNKTQRWEDFDIGHNDEKINLRDSNEDAQKMLDKIKNDLKDLKADTLENTKNIRDEFAFMPMKTNTSSIPQNDYNNTVNKSQMVSKQIDTRPPTIIVEEIANQFVIDENEITFDVKPQESKVKQNTSGKSSKRNSKFSNQFSFNSLGQNKK